MCIPVTVAGRRTGTHTHMKELPAWQFCCALLTTWTSLAASGHHLTPVAGNIVGTVAAGRWHHMDCLASYYVSSVVVVPLSLSHFTCTSAPTWGRHASLPLRKPVTWAGIWEEHSHLPACLLCLTLLLLIHPTLFLNTGWQGPMAWTWA